MSHSTELQVLLLDQRSRWQRGDRVRVETYLERLPALKNDPESILDLIYNEVVASQEAGDQPCLEDYLARFPQFADQLGPQFEVHQGIESSSLTPFASAAADGDVLSRRRPVGPTLPCGFSLDGYEIVTELGRGGMGIVYQARQTRLNRLVALKMILAGAHASPRELARFRTEAEAIARLQHPNIVQIHEVGEQAGLPYFSLELVDGPSLERKAEGKPLPAIEAARLAETLARAVQYAHDRGIIHRDLKPANVLLARDGTPKITDFGLAKIRDASVCPEARTVGLLGTPSYVAPEQAAPGTTEVGPAADVYALGAILYFLVTGRPPFQADTVWATLEQVKLREPLAPRRLAPRLPRDLETICLRCLEKDPRQRYGNAAALADDLARFLDGQPVQARPPRIWERAWKWSQRRPAAAGVVVVSTAAVLGLALFGLWHTVNVQAREAQARVDQRRTELDHLEIARNRYQRFIQGRDEALFRGLRATLFGDAEATGDLQATEAVIEQTLALVNLAVDSDSGPTLDAYWSKAEQAEVSTGCYQLLLLLSETVACPRPAQDAGEHRARSHRALDILRRAAAVVPPSTAYHLRRSRLLAQLGDQGGALEERRCADRLRPAGMIDHFLMGEEWFKQGDLQRAIGHFQDALRAQPDDFWSLFYLSLCHLRLGQPAGARACLTHCRARQPGFLWTYFLSGLIHESLRDYDLAEADYQQALALGPTNEAGCVLHVDRGRLRFRRGDFEGAIEDLKQAIARKPNHFYPYLTLARVYQKQEKWAAADEQLRCAMGLRPPAPQLAQCLLERARTLYLAKKDTDAVEACDAALRVQPSAADGYLVRGRALVRLRRFHDAAETFELYVKFGGKQGTDFYRGRGQTRLQLADYLGARDDYTRALEIEPADAELYLHRGWAYFFSDAWKPALRDFEEAIKRDPKVPDSYCGRGLARVMLGRYREAIQDAEEARRRRPDTPEMTYNIACIFSLAIDRIEHDPALEDVRALTTCYRDRALELVRAALGLLPPQERGSFWREKVLPDAALDPIRNSAEFKRLAEEVAGTSRGPQGAD